MTQLTVTDHKGNVIQTATYNEPLAAIFPRADVFSCQLDYCQTAWCSQPCWIHVHSQRCYDARYGMIVCGK